MQFRFVTGSLMALALVALPSAGGAQTAQAAPPADPAAARQELQAIAQRLGRIEQQALQDPKVKAAHDSLNAFLHRRMPQIEPAYPALVEKAKHFQADALAAQSAGDTAKLRQLAPEGAKLEAGLEAAHRKALQDPGVRQHMAAFQRALLARMAELDPSTPKLLQRLNQLNGSGTP